MQDSPFAPFKHVGDSIESTMGDVFGFLRNQVNTVKSPLASDPQGGTPLFLRQPIPQFPSIVPPAVTTQPIMPRAPLPAQKTVTMPTINPKQGIVSPLPSIPKTTPIPTSTPTPTPQITPYQKPNLTNQQREYADQLVKSGEKFGLKNPILMASTAANESSLNPSPTPNINEYEQSYGPAQINLLAHPEVTIEQAEDPNFAIPWMANRLKHAENLFPDSIEKQILYYNVPQNAYIDPNSLSYQGAWYLMNQLKFIGKTPSQEYIPILQKYGFFK